MITPYVQGVGEALGGVLDLFSRLALSLAVGLGLVVLAGAVAIAFRREDESLRRLDWSRLAGVLAGYVAVGLLAVAAWAALRSANPLARQSIEWRESAQATANPVPDAPPIYQSGPVVAALTERTYTRRLTLPPEFLQRVGEQGVGVLAPYLSDPSAENVLRLVDTFRRSGSDVVFTREVTRLNEEPIPFDDSRVRVQFHRLPGRAYDAGFEGRYVFRNPGPEPATVRFHFTLPQAGTVRDLSVTVGGQTISEPNASGTYEWKGEMAANEQREAVVRYHGIGAKAWNYDLGSQRRRVQHFQLDAVPGGPVRFLRSSLQPSSGGRAGLRWDLTNVVTAQQVGITFPPDIAGRDGYLQALSALPASFVLFLIGALVLFGLRYRRAPEPGRLAAALALFAFGLGASTVLVSYLGPVAGILAASAAGALAAGRVLGRASLMAAVPAALLPAAFLSPEHSGLLVLLLGAAVLAALLREVSAWPPPGTLIQPPEPIRA